MPDFSRKSCRASRQKWKALTMARFGFVLYTDKSFDRPDFDDEAHRAEVAARPVTENVISIDEFRAAVERTFGPAEPQDAPEAVSAMDTRAGSASLTGRIPAGEIFEERAEAGDASHLGAFASNLLDNIPTELKAIPRWVGWRFEVRNGKRNKVPVNVRTGRAAIWSNPDRECVDFKTAIRLSRIRNLEGVGFIFEDDIHFTAIDLDDVRDEDGNLAPHVAEVLYLKESYAEWSPSGNGVHIITGTKIVGQRVNHHADVEIYGNRRFLTITGRLIDGSPSGIHEAPKTIELLTARVDEFDAGGAAEKAQAGHGDATKDHPKADASDAPTPWRAVNDAAIRNYDKWVPAIFPRYKKLASGVLRVASEDRGRRDLQEDISFAPGGIRDFGVEVGRTAIDIVQEFLPARDAIEASRWLCGKLGLDPRAVGFRWAADKPKKNHRKPEPSHDPNTGEIADEEHGAQDAQPEDDAPEVAEANEAVIASMVKIRSISFKAKVAAGIMTDDEAQANIDEFEPMARRAVYERVLDGDFPIKVQLGGNSSREVLVGDIVASPDEFKGKKVRDPYGVASSWIGKLALERGAPRVSMFDKSPPFYLIDKPVEGGDRPWSDKPKAAWLEHAKFDDDKRLISNLENVMVALRHASELEQAFAYDEMNCSVYVMQPLPRVSNGGGVAWTKPSQLTDQHCTQVQEWLQSCGMSKIGIDPIRAGIDLRAREEGRAFHPVKDYLDSLHWDGKSRVDMWLSDYLGAENTDYTQAVGYMFMIAMVARIYKPGCKVDYTLILEGLQGALKSTICKALAGEEWFSDALPDITKDKECSQHIRGKWLIEIAELSSMSKTESNHLKQFLTRQVEKYRPPYGRNEVHEPRQCVFVGTTNDERYLKDPTGGRRFWPVKVGGNLLHEELRADRDLLFAEAVAAFKAGEQWWPNRDFEERYMQPEQQGRIDHDAWVEPIADWLAGINPGHRVRLVDIANMALGLDTSKFGRADQNRVKEILRHLGWGRSTKRLDGYPMWELVAK
ncbi:MAG: VapE domain-containing protein [Methylocystis sp.]|uniref:VapE domain-containing protein n=1 Tax=Methylocystis sp. TaxID=1911079 RepID=UPI003DA358F3